MVACKVAFIDCKMPGSTEKENYSLIGAGVSQSADQVVNITEPHGFSLGVAAMPPGTTNNLHVHYTAEVFMVFSGTWVFRWGAEGRDGEIVGTAGDVVSVPTWIFRGFSNIGNDAGWIFTALGGDDTGGIIWHPSILRTAADHGLYLTKDNMLIDTEAGAEKPAPDELIEPLDEATIKTLRNFDVAAMRSRVVARGERAYSARALLDSMLPGHASNLAPVIGHGMTQDIEHAPPIGNPHGFSVDWLRIAPGERVGAFRLAEKAGAAGVHRRDRGDAGRCRSGARGISGGGVGAWRLLARHRLGRLGCRRDRRGHRRRPEEASRMGRRGRRRRGGQGRGARPLRLSRPAAPAADRRAAPAPPDIVTGHSPPARRATSYDVARAAGVAQSTVSRCFRNDSAISAATRSLVLDAAQRVGYTPNALARSLITQRSDMVGVIITKYTLRGNPDVIYAIGEALAAAGKQLLLITSDGDSPTVENLAAALGYPLDGLISCVLMADDAIREIQRRGINLVLFKPQIRTHCGGRRHHQPLVRRCCRRNQTGRSRASTLHVHRRPA